MNNDPHPVELLVLAGLAVGWALLTLLRTVLVPAVALLLVLAGWRPAAAAPQAPRLEEEEEPVPAAPLVLACSAEPVAIPAPPLERLRVTELRALARAAGLAQLGRRGRRADLLAALQALPA